MIHNLREAYWGDEVNNEIRTFNSIHLIFIIGLSVAALFVYVFVPSEIAFYSTIGIAFMAMLTFVESNRLKDYLIPPIIMDLFFSLLYLPYIFFAMNKIVCMVPVYFIFGLLYSILLLNNAIGVTIVILQTVYHIILIIYLIDYKFTADILSQQTLLAYIGVFVAIVFAGFISGMAVRFKIRQQQEERSMAEVLHSELMKNYMSKNIFLINMSHEIRTPMNAIVGTVNLLLEQDINDHVRDCVYNILNSCNALLSITNELMDISKADMEEVPLSIIRYDFSELILEITNMMSVRLMDSHVDLYIELDDSIPKYLYGDASKIRQIFVNLLNNAIKYTPEGKIILRINSTPISDEDILLHAEIEDTGLGIKEENIPKLFKVYSRVQEDEQRSVEGTGLGLILCQEYLERMDGHIEVKSKYHEGSTFTFELPQRIDGLDTIVHKKTCSNASVLVLETNSEHLYYLKQCLATLNVKSDYAEDEKEFKCLQLNNHYTHVMISYEDYIELKKLINNTLTNEKLVLMSSISQSATLTQSGCILTRPINLLNVSAALSNETNNYVHEIIKKGGFICPKAKILVVDDNLTNLTVANGILKKYQANVITALSGKECLTILDNENIDMIFLDYMMPEMNGIDTLEAIRSLPDPKYAKLPVVCLTANVINGAREMFLESGFNDYISKPIEVEKIERTLKTFLPRNYIEIKANAEMEYETE